MKLDRPLAQILRENWKWILPFLVLGFAMRFIPERVIGSALFFPIVVFFLLVALLLVVWRDSSRR